MSINEIPSETWIKWTEFIEKEFGLRLDDTAISRFKIYYTELVDWNSKINLVSVHSAEEILWRHFADSLAVFKATDGFAKHEEGFNVIDIGTGAGFPGMALKIALPGMHFTLVESILKKCSFLEHMAEKLSLQSLRIFNERAETLGQDSVHREKYDIVLSRGVSKFSPNLELAMPLLKIGGEALFHKTAAFADDAREMALAEKPLRILGGTYQGKYCYQLPSVETEYCILRFKKTVTTPPQYPRNPGMPEKKPL